jgi:hypothetical protein
MVAGQAQQLGESMAKLLMASSFSGPEKQAWAALVPHMSSSQLQRFMALLQKKVVAQAGQDSEDVIVALKAAEREHALSVAAVNEKAHKAVEDFEKEIETAS